jgi:hypothetical protein
MKRLVHQPQEQEGKCTFRTPGLIATVRAKEAFGWEVLHACLYRLQEMAKAKGGLDYLQVFKDEDTGEVLWFIEDAPGLVTALLPEEH